MTFPFREAGIAAALWTESAGATGRYSGIRLLSAGYSYAKIW